MHDIGDMLVGAGFADPVMDMEMLTVAYASPNALMLDLKALGATNATRGRPRGLTGRSRKIANSCHGKRMRGLQNVPHDPCGSQN